MKPKSINPRRIGAGALIVLLLSAVPAFADVLDDLEAGFMAHRRADYQAAFEHYSKVVRAEGLTETERAVAYLLRGQSASAKGDYGQAIQDFSLAVGLKMNYAAAYYFRGLAYEAQGQISRAYEDVKKAVEYSPTRALFQTKLTQLKNKMEATAPVESKQAEGTETEAKPSE